MIWADEAMARQKTMPNYDTWMGRKPEAQTDEQMWDAWESFVARHNAAWQMSVEAKDE